MKKFKINSYVYLDSRILRYINFNVELRFKKVDNYDRYLKSLSLDKYKLQYLSRHMSAVYVNNTDECYIVSDKVIRPRINKARGKVCGLFSYTKFKSVYLEGLDFSAARNLDNLFYSCEIDKISFKNTNTSNVKSFIRTFSYLKCKELDISGLNLSKAVDLTMMFSGAEIEELDTTLLVADRVQNLSYMFSNCCIHKVDLCNIETSSCTTMYGMFEGAYIDVLDILEFDTDKVVDMRLMFSGCRIPKIDLSYFSDYSLAECGTENMFLKCDAKEIDISNFNVEIPLSSFRECTAIVKTKFSDPAYTIITKQLITHLNNNIDSSDKKELNFKIVNSIDSLESKYKILGIKCLRVNSDIICTSNNGKTTLMSSKPFKLCNKTEKYELGVFSGCTFEKIDLHSVMEVDNTNLDYLFAHSVIREIDFGDLDISNVDSLAGLFWGSGTLTTVKNFEKLDTSNVKSMYGMFENTDIEYIDLSKMNTSSVITMQEMFKNCKMKNICLDSFDTSNVINMASMFESCNTEGINLYKLNTSKVINMSKMFRCANLGIKEVDLSKFDLSSVEYLESAFFGIRIPRVTITNQNLNRLVYLNAIFSNCVIDSLVLKDLKIPVLSKVMFVFESANIKKLNISNIYSQNLEELEWAFQDAKINQVSTDNIHFDKLRSIMAMFVNASIDYIDLSFLDGCKLVSVEKAFQDCRVKVINVSNAFDMIKYADDRSKLNPSGISNCGAIIVRGKEEFSREIQNGHIKCELFAQLNKEYNKTYNLKFRSNLTEDEFRVIGGCDAKEIDRNIAVSIVDDTMIMCCKNEIKICGSFYSTEESYLSSGAIFLNSEFKDIDFSNVSTDGVSNISHMFEGCKARNINFNDIDLTSIEKANYLFYRCEASVVDMSKVKFNSLIEAVGMFSLAHIDTLIIGEWEADKLMNVSEMFKDAKINNLCISKISNNSLRNLREMFAGAKIGNCINLDWMNIDKHSDLSWMFSYAQIPKVSMINVKLTRLNKINSITKCGNVTIEVNKKTANRLVNNTGNKMDIVSVDK